jgi:hypothetical protein
MAGESVFNPSLVTPATRRALDDVGRRLRELEANVRKEIATSAEDTIATATGAFQPLRGVLTNTTASFKIADQTRLDGAAPLNNPTFTGLTTVASLKAEGNIVVSTGSNSAVSINGSSGSGSRFLWSRDGATRLLFRQADSDGDIYLMDHFPSAGGGGNTPFRINADSTLDLTGAGKVEVPVPTGFGDALRWASDASVATLFATGNVNVFRRYPTLVLDEDTAEEGAGFIIFKQGGVDSWRIRKAFDGDLSFFRYNQITGDYSSTPLILGSNGRVYMGGAYAVVIPEPTNNDHAATKLYADNGDNATATLAASNLANHLDDLYNAHTATSVGYTPAGSIESTNVQAAISEVAAEAGLKIANIITDLLGYLQVDGAAADINLGSVEVDGGKLVAGSITTAKIGALAVEAGNIAALAVQASHIAADAVSTGNLQANAVISGKIAAGAVKAYNVEANVLSGREISASSSLQVGEGPTRIQIIGTDQAASTQIRTINNTEAVLESYVGTWDGSGWPKPAWTGPASYTRPHNLLRQIGNPYASGAAEMIDTASTVTPNGLGISFHMFHDKSFSERTWMSMFFRGGEYPSDGFNFANGDIDLAVGDIYSISAMVKSSAAIGQSQADIGVRFGGDAGGDDQGDSGYGMLPEEWTLFKRPDRTVPDGAEGVSPFVFDVGHEFVPDLTTIHVADLMMVKGSVVVEYRPHPEEWFENGMFWRATAAGTINSIPFVEDDLIYCVGDTDSPYLTSSDVTFGVVPSSYGEVAGIFMDGIGNVSFGENFSVDGPTGAVSVGGYIPDGGAEADITTISGSKITTRTIMADRIVSGTITAAEIAAGAVTADKLTVGNFGDQTVPNGNFSGPFSTVHAVSGTQWYSMMPGGIDWVEDATSPVGSRVLTNAASNGYAYSPNFSVRSGAQYALSWTSKHDLAGETTGKSFCRIIWLDSSSVYIGYEDVPNISYTYNADRLGADVWETFDWNATAPANASLGRIAIINHGGSTGMLSVAGVTMREVVRGTNIADGAITTDKIVAGAITSDKIDTGAITADKLTVGRIGDQLIPNGDFSGPISLEVNDSSFGAMWYGTAWDAAGRVIDTTSPIGGWVLTNSRIDGYTYSPTFVISAGATYALSATSKHDLAGEVPGVAFFRLRWFNAGGTQLPAHTVPEDGIWNDQRGGANVWGVTEFQITAPTDASFARLDIINHGGSTGTLSVAGVTMREVFGTLNIKDGAITGTTIENGAITTAKIAVGAITANEIAAEAITANEIAAGAVTASKLTITSGGDNLLRDSSFTLGTATTDGFFASTRVPDSAQSRNGGQSLKVSTANLDGPSGVVLYAPNDNSASVASGEPFTVSAWVLMPLDCTFKFGARSVLLSDGTRLGQNSTSHVGTGDWQYLSLASARAVGELRVGLQVYVDGESNSTSVDFWVDQAQIERGDYPSGWKPNSADLSDIAQASATTAIALAATADDKAVLAQGTADTAVTDAADADAAAVAAQGTADTAVADAADALTAAQLAVLPNEVNANVTSISGGAITTGTVDANRLSAVAIRARWLTAGLIVAADITAGAITAAKIDTGAIKSGDFTLSGGDGPFAGAGTFLDLNGGVITSQHMVSDETGLKARSFGLYDDVGTQRAVFGDWATTSTGFLWQDSFTNPDSSSVIAALKASPWSLTIQSNGPGGAYEQASMTLGDGAPGRWKISGTAGSGQGQILSDGTKLEIMKLGGPIEIDAPGNVISLNSGRVNVNAQLSVNNGGSAWAPAFAFDGDLDTGLMSTASGRIDLVGNGTVVAQFNSAGLYLSSNGWLRTYSTAGWINGTYNVGLYADQPNWIRTYGSNAGIISNSSIILYNAPNTTTSSGSLYIRKDSTYGVLMTYSSTRDHKENVQSIESAESGRIIDMLRPVTYIEKYRSEPNGNFVKGVADNSDESANEYELREWDIEYGFIAEELDALEEYGVKLASYDWQQVNDEGFPKPAGWKDSNVTAILVAEVKELRKRIAALEQL